MNWLARALPEGLLRSIDRFRNRRFLALTTPPTLEYVRRYGHRVRYGPFAGMEYIEGLEHTLADLVAKLLGTYEREVAMVIQEWMSLGITCLIDIGCAEGYYAVGYAYAMPRPPSMRLTSTPARERCFALAKRNGVAERVVIGAACQPGPLPPFPSMASHCSRIARARRRTSSIRCLRLA